MLDPSLVESIASALGAKPGLVEKDWHVVRALAVLATLDHGDVTPVFSGGTSLSKGWDAIKRFSEDIDFKAAMVAGATPSQDRRHRSNYRDKVLEALVAEGFELIGEVLKGNNNQFFSTDLAYRAAFDTEQGFRPHIRVEMSFSASALPPIARPIRSLVAQAQRQPAEVAAFLCVDPIETAADKVSALAWRVCSRERGSDKDDPTIIRHLHDLAALEKRVAEAPIFKSLLLQAATADTGRGGGHVPADAGERFAFMLELLRTDERWASEYEEFVQSVSFAAPDERITFTEALEAATRLIGSQ